MTNYPSIDTSRTPWAVYDEPTVFIKCHVTEFLHDESEMILDINTGRHFHKSLVKEYVSLCALEFGWNEEEVIGALKEFNQ